MYVGVHVSPGGYCYTGLTAGGQLSVCVHACVPAEVPVSALLWTVYNIDEIFEDQCSVQRP